MNANVAGVSYLDWPRRLQNNETDTHWILDDKKTKLKVVHA